MAADTHKLGREVNCAVAIERYDVITAQGNAGPLGPLKSRISLSNEGQYIEYTLRVTCEGRDWNVKKRFKEIVALHQILKGRYPNGPELPTKAVVRNFDPAKIEQRVSLLRDHYAADPMLKANSVRKFVITGDVGFAAALLTAVVLALVRAIRDYLELWKVLVTISSTNKGYSLRKFLKDDLAAAWHQGYLTGPLMVVKKAQLSEAYISAFILPYGMLLKPFALEKATASMLLSIVLTVKALADQVDLDSEIFGQQPRSVVVGKQSCGALRTIASIAGQACGVPGAPLLPYSIFDTMSSKLTTGDSVLVLSAAESGVLHRSFNNRDRAWKVRFTNGTLSPWVPNEDIVYQGDEHTFQEKARAWRKYLTQGKHSEIRFGGLPALAIAAVPIHNAYAGDALQRWPALLTFLLFSQLALGATVWAANRLAERLASSKNGDRSREPWHFKRSAAGPWVHILRAGGEECPWAWINELYKKE